MHEIQTCIMCTYEHVYVCIHVYDSCMYACVVPQYLDVCMVCMYNSIVGIQVSKGFSVFKIFKSRFFVRLETTKLLRWNFKIFYKDVLQLKDTKLDIRNIQATRVCGTNAAKHAPNMPMHHRHVHVHVCTVSLQWEITPCTRSPDPPMEKRGG